MKTIDALVAKCDAIEFRDRYALLTESRIDSDTLPYGVFAYPLRHGDDPRIPITIENSVGMNFFGTLLLTHSLDIADGDCLTIDAFEEICYFGEEGTLNDLLESVAPSSAFAPEPEF